MATAKTKPPVEKNLGAPVDEEDIGVFLETLRADTKMWAIGHLLARPFEAKQVKFKPQMVKDRRCLAIAYIDARHVEDRLDEVMGLVGWKDAYVPFGQHAVLCRLTLYFPVEGGVREVTKEGVGGYSDQPDQGDKAKAAESDALKRAAVKFGIGRYLYRMPKVWVDYDPVKKTVVNMPPLPNWAIPKPLPKSRDAVTYHEDEEVELPEPTPKGAPKGGPQAETKAEKPSANGKKEETKEKPRTEKEQTEAVKREWSVAVSACNEPEELNAMLPKLTTVPQFAKEAVWAMIKELVKGDPVNWEYNRSTKKFFKPEAAEATPY